MRVAIITSVSLKSSRDLAEHLKLNGIVAEVFQPYKDGTERFGNYDYVFSYGCSAQTVHKERINSSAAVKRCIDKFATFAAFSAVGVPHPRNWKNKNDIPKDVESLVIRQDPAGRKAEDMSYWDSWENKPIPDGRLFSEWFYHKRELRVTVFKDQVFVYRKDWTNGDHIFNFTSAVAYNKIKEDALKAAKKLEIDYVSFDVLYNSPLSYCFLEANSGSILTDEVSTAIVEWFLNKE